MKKDYKLLLIGNVYDNHLVRFIKHLKIENPNILIHCFSLRLDRELSDDAKKFIDEIYLVPNSTNNIGIPVLRTIVYILNYFWHFRKSIQGKSYDIINIHFPSYVQSFIIPILKKHCKYLILTPWGSDVYRIGVFKRLLLQRLYVAADYITGRKDRFIFDVQKIFNIPESKIVDLGIGSEMLDYISNNKNKISSEDAKRMLGITNRYVITLGYNAVIAQQHLKILDALNEVRDKLPSNLLLIFPLTYPKNVNYTQLVKDKVVEYQFDAIYFEEYLTNEALYVMRQATDVFIHVQTTDANCASLREYLLLNKTIINGSWLVYDDLEINGVKPYYTVNSFDELSKVVILAYEQPLKMLTADLEDYIASLGCIPWAKKWNKFFSSIS